MELPMEVEKILTLLPHRYPFMLVDRIVEYSAEENRIVGLKNLTFNEPFFPGSFSGESSDAGGVAAGGNGAGGGSDAEFAEG